MQARRPYQLSLAAKDQASRTMNGSLGIPVHYPGNSTAVLVSLQQELLVGTTAELYLKLLGFDRKIEAILQQNVPYFLRMDSTHGSATCSRPVEGYPRACMSFRRNAGRSAKCEVYTDVFCSKRSFDASPTSNALTPQRLGHHRSTLEESP